MRYNAFLENVGYHPQPQDYRQQHLPDHNQNLHHQNLKPHAAVVSSRHSECITHPRICEYCDHGSRKILRPLPQGGLMESCRKYMQDCEKVNQDSILGSLMANFQLHW